MGEKDNKLPDSSYKCNTCCKLAPKPSLYMIEVPDYILYFCGIKCYEQWMKLLDADENNTTSSLKNNTEILNKTVDELVKQYPFLSKLFEELNLDCCYGKSITLKECCNWQHIQPTALINKIVVALAANQNQSATK